MPCLDVKSVSWQFYLVINVFVTVTIFTCPAKLTFLSPWMSESKDIKLGTYCRDLSAALFSDRCLAIKQIDYEK